MAQMLADPKEAAAAPVRSEIPVAPRAETPAPTPAAVRQPPARRRLRLVVAALALIALVSGGRLWWRSHYFVETDDAYVAGRLHPVSARVAGVVSNVLVEDNRHVHEGDLLAELDPTDQRIKVEQIVAQIEMTEQLGVQADALIVLARAQASGAVAQVGQADAQLHRAKEDAARYAGLYGTSMKAVSKSEVDAANAALAGAHAEWGSRRDAVAATQAQIAAAEAARDGIKYQSKVLQVQLKDAQQQLRYNSITAPVSGRVGKRSVEVGMRIQPGQQLAAIVQDNVWVVANFKETQLADVRPGQSASVVVDALPDRPLSGRVESFAPASGSQFALLPADNATGNFTKIVQRVPVKILLLPEEVAALQGRLVPGMSVVVEIRKGAPEPLLTSGSH
jgi:membrane fusion protein, multidrug efflux system